MWYSGFQVNLDQATGRLDGHSARLDVLEKEYQALAADFEKRWKDVVEKAHHLELVEHWVEKLEGMSKVYQHCASPLSFKQYNI